MSIRLSYPLIKGGQYDLSQQFKHITHLKIVSITVNGKLLRYSDLTLRESGTPSKHYIEVFKQTDPLCGGMLQVDKQHCTVETFVSSDRFTESVVVTLDMDGERVS